MNKGEKIYLLGIIGMFAGGFALENAFLLGVAVFLFGLIVCVIVLAVNREGFVEDEGETRSFDYDDVKEVWTGREKTFYEWYTKCDMKENAKEAAELEMKRAMTK